MADIDKNLYRSCKSRDWGARRATDTQRQASFLAAEGATALHPNYGFTRRDGSLRPSDVTLFGKDGETWIRGVDDKKPDGKHWVKRTEGVSVGTNKQAMPYSDGWFDFLLPTGTAIPPALDVIPSPNPGNPGHYSIRLKNQMSQAAYHGALDNLARAAIAKAVEKSVPSLYFS